MNISPDTMTTKQITHKSGMALLASLLIIVYTMSNSGGFHIIDEVSRFAVTESIALRGDLDTNAIAWTQWVNTPKEVQGDFGPTGEVYSKKGFGQPLLSVIWYFALLAFSRFSSSVYSVPIGTLQGMMLFTSFITAATATLVWHTARKLEYSDRTGLTLALLFGLATIAWPYATYLLAEPLSSLCLLICFYALVSWRKELALKIEGQGKPLDTTSSTISVHGINLYSIKWLWLVGGGAAGAIATTVVHAAILPILGLYWLITSIRFLSQMGVGTRSYAKILLSWALPICIPILASLLLISVYNFARFDTLWNTGYQIFDGEYFTTPIGQGMWGLLFSPYRSVFLHSPIFLASLFTLPLFHRRHQLETWTIVGISVVIIVLYSTWWMWWGGYAWGPRFLVPLAPFWILLLAPAIEKWFPKSQPSAVGESTTKFWRISNIGLLLLIGLSIVVQFSAVSVNYVNYETELRRIFPTDWLEPLRYGPPAVSIKDILYSPVLGQWRLLFRAPIANNDVAWIRPNGDVLWSFFLPSCMALLITATLLLLWWQRMTQQSKPQKNLKWLSLNQLGVWLASTGSILVVFLWLIQIGSDPRYGIEQKGYREILSQISTKGTEQDAIITVAPYHYTIPMNWFRSTVPIYGYAADSLKHQEALMLLTSISQKHPRIWFVTAGLPPADVNNSVERWLVETGYKATDQWYDDFRLVRLAAAVDPLLRAESVLNQQLMDANNKLTIIKADHAMEAKAGQIFAIEITFRMEKASVHNLRWFVQLLNADGEPIAMTDTASQGGYRSFIDLPIATELTEKIGLQLPQEIAQGRYQLIVGLYNPEQDGERLKRADGQQYVVVGSRIEP